MRRLILMRHAKSSWADPGQPDFDRPLNDRGKRSAATMGAWLAKRGIIPEAALVSASVRTQETWSRLGPAFADVPMTPLAGLYHAKPETLLAALGAAPDVQRVLVLSHHPGIAEFALKLLADDRDHPGLKKFPTAAVAVIDFDFAAWSAVDWRLGTLAEFVTPAELV